MFSENIKGLDARKIEFDSLKPMNLLVYFLLRDLTGL
jgi:hypothetical protein